MQNKTANNPFRARHSQRQLAILAIAFVLALSIALSGCAGNQYIPCCQKDYIYNSTTKKMQPNPVCVFPPTSPAPGAFGPCVSNDTLFKQGTALCLPTICPSRSDATQCQKSGCIWKQGGSPPCTALQCADITTARECNASLCSWSDSSGKCGAGASATAYKLMPVCVDDAPKSCVNDKCTAMMCGYSDFKPGPPPSSQDWNANATDPDKVIAQSDVMTPEINLQGTSCGFQTMNNKLFNRVKNAKGSLWVNSFRFGVGSSFSDYEQARNFFPQSDRFCSTNQVGTVDRFTNYLNMPNDWCQPVRSHFQCTQNGLTASDQDTCGIYCKGDKSLCTAASGPAYKCADSTYISKDYANCTASCGKNCVATSDIAYKCNSDSMTYSNQLDCRAKCDIVSDQNACTVDNSQYTFLDANGRFPMKYTADYMVDAWSTGSKDDFDDVCQNKIINANPGNNFDTNGWKADHSRCNDFYDGSESDNPTDGPWGTGSTNDMSVYWGVKRTGQIDFDYSQYDAKLMQEFTVSKGYDPDQPLPFECMGGDCISGSCDHTYHKRTLCQIDDPAKIKKTSDCGCDSADSSDPTQAGKKLLDCNRGFSAAQGSTYMWLWDGPHVVGGTSSNGGNKHATGNPSYSGFEVVPTGGKLFDRDGATGSGAFYKYYIPHDASSTDDFFSKCQITKKETVNLCLYAFYDDKTESPARYQFIEFDASGAQFAPNSQCPYELDYYDLPDNPKILRKNPGDTGDPNKNRDRFFFPQSENAVTYDVYEIDMAASPEKWGICKLDASKRPYVNYTDLGWCAGCTYATMAVQKIGWGDGANGFPGYLKNNACYEWQGDYNYDYSSAYWPSVYPIRDVDGTPGVDASAAKVRATRIDDPDNGGLNSPLNGNINRGRWEGSSISNLWQSDTSYNCLDMWNDDYAWWSRGTVPNPSAPFLKQKLQSYLQSNVMPILDVQETTEIPNMHFNFGHGRPWSLSFSYSNYYPPTDVCTKYMGDGAAIYAVGNTDMLKSQAIYDSVASDGEITSEFFTYIGKAPPSSSHPLVGLDGASTIMARATKLEGVCQSTPMTAIEIAPGETLDNLVGTPGCDLLDPSSGCRGTLHRFFYTDQGTTGMSYAWNVANGKPDKIPGKIDMFLITWAPMCGGLPGEPLENRTRREFADKLAFTRALASNFSKPSLVWKFHFPSNSKCHADGNVSNYDYFLNYTFNRMGDMVDASMIGLIYDSWMTESGKGLGVASQSVWSNAAGGYGNEQSNLDPVVADNPLDSPIAGKKYSPFCSLQKYSKEVISLQRYTYGQKLVGTEDGCECVACKDADYSMGLCNRIEPLDNYDAEQLYCNDGNKCALPAGASPGLYKCPSTCLNSSACELCSDATNDSFCKIERTGEKPVGVVKPLSNITEMDWEFIAGLPAREKCCFATEQPDQPPIVYTYTERKGVKSQSEFLQYPTRGEEGIDCGRVPNTDVLKYCGITIPISQIQVECNRIN